MHQTLLILAPPGFKSYLIGPLLEDLRLFFKTITLSRMIASHGDELRCWLRRIYISVGATVMTVNRSRLIPQQRGDVHWLGTGSLA